MIIRQRTAQPALTLRSLLLRAYVSAGLAWMIFGIGYGLSLIDGRPCMKPDWSCNLPGMLLQAGFLAAALASLPYSAHRLDLGLPWVLMTGGLTGLILANNVPLPVASITLLASPGIAVTLVYLVRNKPSDVS